MSRLGLVAILFSVTLVGCGGGGDNSSPTGPSSSTPSRIMGLAGNLAFGTVNVGSSSESTLTITNSGTQTLTVTGMTISGGFGDQIRASWTSGGIAPGASQAVRIAFVPTTPGAYSGTLTVNGDQTSGNNTVPVSGTGAGVSAAGAWTGSYVVERCDGTGSVQDLFCSAARGLYPPGSQLPIALALAQTGSNVSGTVFFGQVSGPVTGAVSSAGTLTLQGAAVSGPLTLTISNWNTPINGNAMTGVIGFTVGSSGTPGVAAITARLSNVTR